ncbi:phospho-acceptor domain-containing protein [Pseudomonas duriflava]|uniref:histidine kinase n=1 Tax=Pseudomonas duriflava TaxID=459528 RepID=A0A562QIT7_9PSED|nr:GAF domain-containing sensor histidine kinase [Pseudomonas duriflava]TWI56672.1 phospho-acceptor domain-containing protein [Pseudomonas duriflava]
MRFNAPHVPVLEPDMISRDAQRLLALRQTRLLDSAPEEGYDRLTRMCARLLGVPIAFISLVDEARVFYKSHYGFPPAQALTREVTGTTLCHYALSHGEPLVINDVSTHPLNSRAAWLETFGVGAYLGVPLELDDGQLLGCFAVIDEQPRLWLTQDIEFLIELARSTISEIKLGLALDAAQQHARWAREATRAREELLAVVAHDLRTPLSVVTMAFGLLDGAALNERQRELVMHARVASAHMGRLIDELLEIAQMEQNQLELRLAALDPQRLVDDALAMLRPLAERGGIQLMASCESGLPAIRGDYERLLRVFSNLISNAVKFSEAGTTVWVSAMEEPRGVRFTVSDNGPGIEARDLEFIFDRFWQVKKRERQGVGLGLAIVKAIVEAHGGRIQVNSTPGEGSDFCFHLPLALE